jgi:uncharacterized protein (DUF1697 family)
MVVISLLRAVNVGGHSKMKMETLRSVYESLGFTNVRTYVQSGNVVCASRPKDLRKLAAQIEEAIDREFGFRPDVILRSVDELREVVAKNPFADRDGIEPGKLAVNFLSAEPSEEARAKVLAIKADPEELRFEGKHLFIYFPNGMGRTKLPLATIGRALKVSSTARNWNTVTKLLAMAEE